MNIRFVSLISRENKPLYIQSFTESDINNETSAETEPDSIEMNELLKYNFLSHMSLDVFESPFAPSGILNNTGKPALLFVQDGILVYGIETQTGLKIVIGCSRFEKTINEEDEDDKSTDAARIFEKEDNLGSLQGFAEKDVKEAMDLQVVINKIKKEYVRYTCNPFFDVKKQEEISNPKFDLNIKKIVEDFNFQSNKVIPPVTASPKKKQVPAVKTEN